MITIPDVVAEIVRASPILEEQLQDGIINLSALARRIRPEVAERTMKEVQEGAIVMALKRLTLKGEHAQSSIQRAFKEKPDMIVRSNLMYTVVKSSEFSMEKHRKILKFLDSEKRYFLTISQSVFETAIIASRDLKDPIRALFDARSISAHFDELSSITIRLSRETTLIPGVYYMILKHLAWEGINLVEVLSTYTELTLVLQTEDTDRAFSALKRIF